MADNTVTHETQRILSASHWGAYYARVSNGRIVGIDPFEHDPAPSTMIDAVPDAVHAPCRVGRPSIREGWLRHGHKSSGTGRGSERFVEFPWDEALDLVAGEIDRVRREHGNQAIFGGSYGWSSAGRFHHAKSQVGRFLNASGGCVSSVGNYSMGAGMVIVPHILGSDQPLWGPTTGWDILARHTELFVSFGGLPQKNSQIEAGGVGEHNVGSFLAAAKANGSQFVLISPTVSDVPDFAGPEWVPIVPNTDTGLMLGLAHTLHTEGLYDRAFIEKYTVGLDRFLPYLTGADDGCPKSADWAAGITGVPAETVRTLARRMASKRTFVTLSLSVQRCDHGEQSFWMGTVLAAMLGQIGLPGGGLGFGYSAVHGTGNPVPRFRPPTLPGLDNPVDAFIPCARITDLLSSPGDTCRYDGQVLTYPDIKLVYWCGGNPMHHHQDLNRMLAAFRRPETIIVNEPWWTPFARHADIVLPATTTSERNDIMSSKRDRYIVAMKKVIEPIGEARDDFAIFRDLARRLGSEQVFAEGRSEMEWLAHIYESSRKSSRALGVEMPDFETFWSAGYIILPKQEQPYEPFADFRADPETHPLGTPSGRIEIFSETVAGFGYEDCGGHPSWMEPVEWLGAEAAQRFPLHLLSNQPSTRLHSQLDMTAVGQSKKIKGREPIHMAPADAARRSLADGDVVRVFNDRGACLAAVRIDERHREGVVIMATGGWYDPLVPGEIGTLEKGGNPNVLTLDKGTSSLAQGTSAQTALVEVERWDAELPPISAYDPPEFAPRPVD